MRRLKNIVHSDQTASLISLQNQLFQDYENIFLINQTFFTVQFSSGQFSLSVVSDSLWPNESQQSRPPWPGWTGLPVHHQLPEFTQTHAQWVGDAIQTSDSSVVPFSSCPQSLPASGSFPVSQLFAWGGQSIGVSASASVLPVYTQDWSPLVTLLLILIYI